MSDTSNTLAAILAKPGTGDYTSYSYQFSECYCHWTQGYVIDKQYLVVQAAMILEPGICTTGGLKMDKPTPRLFLPYNLQHNLENDTPSKPDS